MDFQHSERSLEYQGKLTEFMDECIYPAEAVYEQQMRESDDPHHFPAILDELKAEAKKRGLWNLFHPHLGAGGTGGAGSAGSAGGDSNRPGLTNAEYAPLAEIMGRSMHLAPEACNCNAPDTGNMEVFELYGTDEHREKYLEPLLSGEIRSAFAMTEPGVASSDATNVRMSMERTDGGYVLNGRKWFTSNGMHPHLKVMVVMGKTSPDAEIHRQQSMLAVPADAPGVTIVRNLPVFGYHDREGHAEVHFKDVFVPDKDILGGEGMGFKISQDRLGPGRIHHCMRAIGMAERALELMCTRALSRTAFGKPLANRDNIRDQIAQARIDIEQARLLTMKAAWMMDTVGNKAARQEIAAIKVAAPAMALRIVDQAIQVHGGEGVTDDTPLAAMWAGLRTLRLADGPDEVHRMTIARAELRKYRDK
ncbi:acyl-CoA dehydrogenase family protein [Corynebacterium jeikeium]|uniref:acyl-CoA dehydrogenase family protein n=1 Tax=Corynebacterium jeikeium TaxID=38289 RepID=UPI0005509FCD|nr:acyl-CoA dehydrogenase family protein [Corynebacterium jeikeium]